MSLLRYAYASSIDCRRSERINERSTVPGRNPLNLHFPANSPDRPYGERRPFGVLLQLGAAVCMPVHRIERRLWDVALGRRTVDHVILSVGVLTVYPATVAGDITRWAARVGRHALERISKATEGRLTGDRYSWPSLRAKAGLTVFWPPRNADANAGPSDHQAG